MASTPETGDIIANAATDFGGGPLRWTRTGANAASVKEEETGRFGASADQMQYLLGSSLEFLSEGVGFDNLSAYWGAVRAKNKAELEQYDRVTFKDAEFGNDLSKYFLDLLVIDGATLITSALAAAGATALTGGGTLAALSGAGIASFALNAGDTFAESVEAVGKENVDKGLVLGASLLMAGLDAAVPGKIGGVIVGRGIREKVKASAAKNLAKNKWWSRALKVGLQSGLTEAGTEGMQEVLQAATINAQEGKDPFDFSAEQIAQFKEAAWAGGFLGGGAGVTISGVGRSSARKIIGRKEEAVAQLDSELESKIAELEAERTSLAEQPRTFEVRKRSNDIRKEISDLRVEANKKKAKIWGADSEAAINKIVPIKEQEAEPETEAAPEKEKTLAQIMAEDPRTAEAERQQQPDEVLPVGTQRGPSATQEQIDARLAQEPSGPTQADVMPDVMPGTPVAPRPGTPTAEAAARADRGLQEEGFQDPSVLEDTAPMESGADPSVLLDQAPDQVGAGPQGRPRRSFAALREEIKARAEGPQAMNRPVINTVIGDSENVLVDGDVLITAADIEEAKFAKASRELEDEASTAYNEAYNEVVLETGGDHGQASIAGEEARTRVLREGGATKRRVYSSRAARLQAQREAAKQRQDREARLNFEAQRRIDEQKKFEKEQAAELKEQAIEMAGETYDAFFYGQISAQEFASRRQSEIARIKDGIGGTAAVNAYRKAVPLEKANAILKERGLPTLKPEGDQTTQKDAAPDKTTPTTDAPPPAPESTPEAAPEKAPTTQADATPPTPEAAPTPTQADAIPPVPDTTETAPVAAEDTEAAPATTPQGEDTTPTQEAETTPDETAEETGKATPPPDIAVTDVDEDQTQEQQIADMIAREQASVAREVAGEQADAEFQAGTDDTGPVVEDVDEGVNIPVVDTTAVTPDMTQADLVEDTVVGVEDTSETVIPEATTTGIELDKYESSVPNPQGVEAIVYEDPENPDSFIVESEGTVIRRESNKQDAILYADKMSEFVANREKKKARNAFVPRPEGKTYTGKFLKGLGRGTKALLAGTGKTGDSFRLSLDKNKRNIADNNNIPYDDTTTEEDLYDALYAKYIAPKEEAAPTDVEPADVAGEVQEEAKRIVASDYGVLGNKINRTYPEPIDEYSSDDEVDASIAARAARQEYAETDDPSELIDLGWDDADAEIRAQATAEAKERAERTAENRAVKLTPGYWTEMLDTNTALKDISKTKSQGGFEISELRIIADNILKADPSFVYNKKGTRKEIEAAIKSYIIKDVEPVEDNSPYVDTVDDDTGIISTEYKESRITSTESIEEENARLKKEIARLEELVGKYPHPLDIMQDYDEIRADTIQGLKNNLTLLQEAQIALSRNPPKVNVMVDHADRVIGSMKKQLEKIRSFEGHRSRRVDIETGRSDKVTPNPFLVDDSVKRSIAILDTKQARIRDQLEGLDRGFNSVEVESSLVQELGKIFGARASSTMRELGFVNIINRRAVTTITGKSPLEAARTAAFVMHGEVYFVPENIAENTVANNDTVRGIIWHEIGAHIGSKLLSSNEFSTVIDQVKRLYTDNDSYAVTAYNQVAANYEELLPDSPDNMFWEEVLAHMLQYKGEELNLQRPSLMKRVKDAFKKFFIRVFKAYDVDSIPDVTVDDIFNVMAGVVVERIPPLMTEFKVSKSFKDDVVSGKAGGKGTYSDYLGRAQTKARNEFIEDSLVKDTVFHGSEKNWSAPILEFTEMGLHVGTMKAALKRVDGNSEKLTEGYIKVTNPFTGADDIGHWAGPLAWRNELNKMMRDGNISDKDYQVLFSVANEWVQKLEPFSGSKEIYDGFVKFSSEYRDALKSLGYDSIQYVNKSEDPGNLSYILLSEDQFKNVNSLTFSSGVNAVRDARIATESPSKNLPEIKKINDVSKGQVFNTRKAQGKITQVIKTLQRAVEPLMTLEGYDELETQRMLTKGEIGKWHNQGRVIFDVIFQATPEEKKEIIKYFETRDASPDKLPNRKVNVAKLPTVLSGTKGTGRLSEEKSIRDSVVEAKKQIEKLGADLVAAGLITQDQYSQWRGKYLPRVYFEYLDKGDRIPMGIGTSQMNYTKVRSAHENFLKDVVEGRIEDPAFLAGRYVSMAGADLATINYLSFLAADTGNNGWVLPNQIVKYDNMEGTVGFWNEKIDAIRRNAARERGLNNSAKADSYEKIANQIQKEVDKVTANKIVSDPKKYKQVPDNPRYGAMRGLYVRKEIINDVLGTQQLYTNNEFLNGALSYTAKAQKVFKYTKVPMNIPTQARNVISNIVLMDVSGTNFFRIPGLISRAITDIASDGKYAQLARKYGIESTTFTAEELVNIDAQLSKIKAKEDSWGGMWAKTKVFFNDYVDVFGRTYQKTEVMFKVAKMIDFMENHGKSESEAAKLANEALLDYSNVSQAVRVIRTMPLGSPFITFNLKAASQMVRNIKNHPIAVAKYAAIPYVVAQMLLENNSELEEDDIPEMKKLVAEYMEDNATSFILPWKDQEGRLRVFDMGYFLPWGAHLNMMKNLYQGEFGKASSVPGFFGGWIGAPIGMITNVDPFTKQEITNDADPPMQQYQDMTAFLLSYMMPPMIMPRNKSGDVISNGGQLIKTGMAMGFIDGNVDADGLPKYTIPESLMSWAGVNFSKFDKNTAQRKIYFKALDVKNTYKRLKKFLKDPNISEEQRQRLISEYTANALRLQTELQEMQNAYAKVRDVL